MLRCPRPDCNRAGDDLGRCADRQVLGCPSYVEVTTHDIVLRCTSCNLTRTITVDQAMKGRHAGGNMCQGDTDQCKAVVLSGKALSAR